MKPFEEFLQEAGVKVMLAIFLAILYFAMEALPAIKALIIGPKEIAPSEKEGMEKKENKKGGKR